MARFAAANRTACPWSADWDCSGETRRSCVPSVCRCSRGSCPTGALCFPAVFGCQTIPVAKPPCRSGGQAARRSGCACPYGLPKPWRDSPIPSRSPSSADSARPSSCRPSRSARTRMHSKASPTDCHSTTAIAIPRPSCSHTKGRTSSWRNRGHTSRRSCQNVPCGDCRRSHHHRQTHRGC